MIIKGEDVDFYGKWVHDNWNLVKLNDFVITSFQENTSNTLNERIGRIVQIRPNEGIYGGDVVLLRMVDNSLTSHDNQSFCIVKDSKIKYLTELFKDVHVDDPFKYEYSIVGKDKRRGFYAPMFKKGDVVKLKDDVISYPQFKNIRFRIDEFYSNPFMTSLCGNYNVSDIVCTFLEIDKIYLRNKKIKQLLKSNEI